METLNNLLTFIGSYPTWAKLVILVAIGIIAITLVFAPRSSDSHTDTPAPVQSATSTNDAQHVYLKIKPIELYPDNPDAEVRLSAIVNDTRYVHPSIGGVQWMKVGSAMSEKIIELPKSDRYRIRFELEVRDAAIMISQMVTPVSTLPYTGEYPLYSVNGGTRDAGVSAVVHYEIYRQ